MDQPYDGGLGDSRRNLRAAVAIGAWRYPIQAEEGGLCWLCFNAGVLRTHLDGAQLVRPAQTRRSHVVTII